MIHDWDAGNGNVQKLNFSCEQSFRSIWNFPVSIILNEIHISRRVKIEFKFKSNWDKKPDAGQWPPWEAVIDSIRELSIQTLEVTRVTIMCWCSTDNNIKIYFVEDTCVGQRMCRRTRKGRLAPQLERSKQALQQTLIQATWTTELSSSMLL